MSVSRVLPWMPAAVVLGGFALQALPDSGVEESRQFSRRVASVRTVDASERIGSAAPRYVGAGSCAASNCHGGSRVDRVTAGSEHSIWIQSDPHANAHTTLHSRESRQIAEKLGLQSAQRGMHDVGKGKREADQPSSSLPSKATIEQVLR